jgi:hypothetical protein
MQKKKSLHPRRACYQTMVAGVQTAEAAQTESGSTAA